MNEDHRDYYTWKEGDLLPVTEKSGAHDFVIEGNIVKLDKAQHLVFGWASIVEIGGKPVTDTQKDIIDPEVLEESVYEYVLTARKAGEMHEAEKADGPVAAVGKLVESVVFTKEKQKAMLKSLEAQGIKAELDMGCVGWWIGFKVTSEPVWSRIIDGTLRAFSIGGRGKRAAL